MTSNLDRWSIAKAYRDDAEKRIAECFIVGDIQAATEARNNWFAHDAELDRLNKEFIATTEGN